MNFQIRRLTKLFDFLITNFGPLVGFYIVNQFFGYRAGILASLVIIFAEFVWLKLKKERVAEFFYFSSGIIFTFGIADLFFQEAYFMKFEASMTNLFFAVFFWVSIFRDKSIIQEFAEVQGRTSSETSIDKAFFFRTLTVAWALYFLIKAVFYLWLSFSSSIGEAFIVRMFVGKLSFFLMMFLSIGVPKKIWKLIEMLRLFPSQRNCGSL